MSGLFDNEPVTLAEQIACVKRELGYRWSVYKRRVADGKMKQEKMDYEIRVMGAVLATLEDLQRAGIVS